MNRHEDEGLTALEALGVAIRAELDSRDIYNEMADRAQDELVARRFELLAAEEDRHRDLLVARWTELAPNVPLKLPPSALPEGLATREKRSTRGLTEVLELAIEEERRSRDFYLSAARGTADLSGQAMFRFLADMEYAHWMTLAQERDLLARYPNYGRPGPKPWRVEVLATTGERGG